MILQYKFTAFDTSLHVEFFTANVEGKLPVMYTFYYRAPGKEVNLCHILCFVEWRVWRSNPQPLPTSSAAFTTELSRLVKLKSQDGDAERKHGDISRK